MADSNPLVQAMQLRQKGSGDSTGKLLEMILSHFHLVPKEAEAPSAPEKVVTQESHTP